MHRRNLLKGTAVLGLGTTLSALASSKMFASTASAQANPGDDRPMTDPRQLVPPLKGRIPVAFPISKGAQVIDFCGPWEVFADVPKPGTDDNAFQVYIVAETLEPVTVTGGMTIVPNFTFETAPAPKVIVIPAQDGASEKMLEWIRASTKNTDVTMSVCTGAFVLARTGLLSGKSATTFHQAFDHFEAKFPDIHLKRGARFVEDGNLASSGGLTAGIDLAFRVVERYYGRAAAENTAYRIEYQGKGWMDADSNEIYRKYHASNVSVVNRLCPVCGMKGDSAITSIYKEQTYCFCMEDHRQAFEKTPDAFVKAS